MRGGANPFDPDEDGNDAVDLYLQRSNNSESIELEFQTRAITIISPTQEQTDEVNEARIREEG